MQYILLVFFVMRQYTHQPSTQHYFNQASQDPQSYFPIEWTVAWYKLKMQSASGIFSAQEFDKGTKLLLKHFKLSSNLLLFSSSSRVLDLGCGYGLVSYFLISRYASKISALQRQLILDACDSSPLAIDVTTANIHWLHSPHVTTHIQLSDILSDQYFLSKTYDYILTNPPFSAGKATVQQFLQQSYHHLNSWGQLRVVAPTQRWAKWYIETTKELFGPDNVVVVALEWWFRIRKATKL